MVRRQLLLLQLGVIGVILSACQGLFDLPSNVQDPSVLFQDDFSRYTGGWPVNQTIVSLKDYYNGGYRIQILEANRSTLSLIDLSFSDLWIDVSTKKVQGPDKNGFGIFCRYKDDNNYYFSIVASDGYYGIGKRKFGKEQLLGSDVMNYSQVIMGGDGAENQLRLGCIGDEISLFVNGEHLLSIHDSDFSNGKAGFFAGTFDQPGTDILFDDFVIRKP